MTHILTNRSAFQNRSIYQLTNGDYLCKCETFALDKDNRLYLFNCYELTYKYFYDAIEFVEYRQSEVQNADT